VSNPANDQQAHATKQAVTGQTAAAIAQGAPGRLEQFKFDIASGMLESLGLNMYTSIGKSLSEFVANAYDAEASNVWIEIPFKAIDIERDALRDRAKAEVSAQQREKFTVLSDPLPDHVTIVIRDDGHGMLPQEIQDKFLIINRNRRKDSATSEGGKRNVMGRKGLGKLAGFGTAECITIWSKRAGMAFATEFMMDYSKIKQNEKMHESRFVARYHDGLPTELHGTRITLSGLRCDSLKASRETIAETLSQNFAVFGDAFKIFLGLDRIEETPAQYEYVHPEVSACDDEGFGTHTVKVSDMFSFDIRYAVRFRARETDDSSPPPKDAKGRELRRGPLSTNQRGARIYCHGRLAAGPTLLKLPTGMHNFHAQSYMECIIHANEIDRQSVDYIGTNRGDLKGDSDVVESLRDAVTELMRLALYEHSKFRDQKVDDLLEKDEFTIGLLARVELLPKGIKASTKKVLKTLASAQGVMSDIYRSTAPLVMQGLNAGEVLSNLIRLEADPKSIQIVAHELFELAKVENADVLKLYRGRRAGIEAMRGLVDRARENWKKGSRFENLLHQTLKENPWLLGPEFNRCLTSDKPLADVASELTKELGVDQCAAVSVGGADGEIDDDDDRPDLVFVAIDSHRPSVVWIVELKSPNIALRKTHYEQLDAYRFRVEQWLAAKFAGSRIAVKCLLVGDLDVHSKSHDVLRLNELAANQGAESKIRVLPLRVLLDQAKPTHLDAIEVAMKNEEFYEAELSTERNHVAANDSASKAVAPASGGA
jgi:hypothetical protein